MTPSICGTCLVKLMGFPNSHSPRKVRGLVPPRQFSQCVVICGPSQGIDSGTKVPYPISTRQLLPIGCLPVLKHIPSFGPRNDLVFIHGPQNGKVFLERFAMRTGELTAPKHRIVQLLIQVNKRRGNIPVPIGLRGDLPSCASLRRQAVESAVGTVVSRSLNKALLNLDDTRWIRSPCSVRDHDVVESEEVDENAGQFVASKSMSRLVEQGFYLGVDETADGHAKRGSRL